MNKAEKFISEHTKDCSNFDSYAQWPIHWITPDNARKAVKIARKEIYEWLRINLCDYFDAPREDYDMCINDLKQAIKDE